MISFPHLQPLNFYCPHPPLPLLSSGDCLVAGATSQTKRCLGHRSAGFINMQSKKGSLGLWGSKHTHTKDDVKLEKRFKTPLKLYVLVCPYEVTLNDNYHQWWAEIMRCKKLIKQSSNPIKHIRRERAVLWKHCWPDELPVWMGVSVCGADGRARHTAFTRHLQWDRMKGGAATVNRKQAIISAWGWKSIQEKLWSVVLCSLAFAMKSTKMWKRFLCLLFVPFFWLFICPLEL